jgi:dihydroorotate dehydrogenase
VRRDAIDFNLQVAHAASVQKRDLISDIVGNVTQQIEGGINQAQNMIQGVMSQVAGVTANVAAGMQNTVTAIITQVTKVPQCATAMTINVSSVMIQAGMLLYQLY